MKAPILTSTFVATLISTASAETALTIYNQNLAVVRETIPLDLKTGENSITFDQATAQVLPDSVVLRDPKNEANFSILEQSYRNDPVSKWLLLEHFRGKQIKFLYDYADGKSDIISGTIVRSGFVPGRGNQDPIIEVDGKLRFELPGEPLFPTLGDDSILKPTLSWEIQSDTPTTFDAQLSYLSRGFKWEADYNFVAPEKGETVSVSGWITAENNSGTAFKDAKVKLVAGDVNIIKEHVGYGSVDPFALEEVRTKTAAPAVQEKSFDDFHLYTLQRPLSIRDKETKQVEFLRAPKVIAQKAYVYDGLPSYRYHGGRNTGSIQGQNFSKDVSIFWEFTNNEESGLGIPLPAGRVRFYRSDDEDGNLEFVGENNIDHTPRNEEVSIYTGNAFDLVGDRKVTDFQYKKSQRWLKESVEVTVKNRSKDPKTIIVYERLWRWLTWEIQNPTMEFEKTDAQTIEFTVPLEPDTEKTITYTAHYTW